MLDYFFQFLLFCGKVLVIGGLLFIIVGMVAKLKKSSLIHDETDDPERARLVITDYAKLLESDRLRVLGFVCSDEQKKFIKNALKREEKAAIEAEKAKMKAKEAELKEAKESSEHVVVEGITDATGNKDDVAAGASSASAVQAKEDIKDETKDTAKETAVEAAQEAESKDAEAKGVETQEETKEKDVSSSDTTVKAEKSEKADKASDASTADDGKNVKVSRQTIGESIGIHALFIVDFDGSTTGQEVKYLRRAVTLLVQVAEEGDEVLLRMKSPGGTVNGYGLCAAELERLRRAGLRLTVAVDEVAASGGYMMACVGSRIIAAPFAYIGSIGVVATLPNFNRVLKKYDVDYEQVTAGEYKRTLTMFGENTEEGREKFKEELKAIHDVFKAHVNRYRPQVDMDNVGTGEHWLAVDALKLGLVDEIMTSDEYILNNIDSYDRVLRLQYKSVSKRSKNLSSFVSGRLAQAATNLVERFTGVKL